MEGDKLELRDKLLELYRKLMLSPKSNENIMDLYVEYLKLMIEYDYSLPSFKRFQTGFITGNCYTYALDLKCPLIYQALCLLSSRNNLNLNVGFISDVNNRCEVSVTSEKELLENLYADLDYLKIKVFESDLNKEPSHGGYKIFAFKANSIKDDGDFHFVRRNGDGTLSHKEGYNESVKRIKSLSDVHKDYELVRSLEIVKPKF